MKVLDEEARGEQPAGSGGRRAKWLATHYRQPVVWAPPAALVALAWVLAELVEPWPEGRILLTLKGFGPHGITVSDLLLLGILAVVTVAWVWTVSAPAQADTRVALGTLERSSGADVRHAR